MNIIVEIRTMPNHGIVCEVAPERVRVFVDPDVHLDNVAAALTRLSADVRDDVQAAITDAGVARVRRGREVGEFDRDAAR